MRRSVLRSLAILFTVAMTATACGGGGGTGAPAATTAAPAAAATTAAAAAPPTRPVEFVIQTGPGGASDIYARLWISIMDKERLVPQPVQALNKEGGAGATAFTYVFQKRGEHALMVTLNSFWTTIITQKLPYKTTDFTAIANLALDPFFLWVHTDSPIKTAQEFVTTAKERSLVASGTGSKQEDEVLFRRIEGLAGTKPFTYVPQSGGGAVAAALAGKQGGVEVTVNNPSEARSLMQQGRLRAVCSFTPNVPTGIFAGIPTCKSQGLAIDDYYNVRSVVGPPGMSPGQQAFWADVFKKVADSADWKKFVEDNALNSDFRAGADFQKLIADYQKLHEEIAAKNGWVQ